MLNGQKTYITIIITAAFNALQNAGMTGIDDNTITVIVNLILGCSAMFFNKSGRDKLKKIGGAS